MSMSKELFLSILAMDAYNRGYGAGLGSQTDGLGSVPGTRIGNAVILNNPIPDDSPAAGFYAVAYQMDGSVGAGADILANGQTVISYRGTDNIAWELLPVDFPISVGDYDEPQIYLTA